MKVSQVHWAATIGEYANQVGIRISCQQQRPRYQHCRRTLSLLCIASTENRKQKKMDRVLIHTFWNSILGCYSCFHGNIDRVFMETEWFLFPGIDGYQNMLNTPNCGSMETPQWYSKACKWACQCNGTCMLWNTAVANNLFCNSSITVLWSSGVQAYFNFATFRSLSYMWSSSEPISIEYVQLDESFIQQTLGQPMKHFCEFHRCTCTTVGALIMCHSIKFNEM